MAKTLSIQWSECISLTMGLRPAFLLDCGLFIECMSGQKLLGFHSSVFLSFIMDTNSHGKQDIGSQLEEI